MTDDRGRKQPRRRHKPTEKRPPPKPSPEAARPPDDLLARFPRPLRDDLIDLLRHEKRIVAALEDDATATRFLAEPAATLREMGIPVSPALAKRLKRYRPMNLLDRRTFRTPTGQLVTPRVNVRIVRKTEG